MAKYIFYTDEGYTVAPNGQELESYQILGFENGKTLQDAMEELLKNNPWIIDANFDLEKIRHKKILSSEE